MKKATKRVNKSSRKSRKGSRNNLAAHADNSDFQQIQDQERAASNPEQSDGDLFPIVGVGASAGGLEAFTRLVEQLPVDTGMAFVLVQHLDPEHESKLPQLLGRATKLPVLEVANNTRVQPDRIYVIPPNKSMTIERRILKLVPRKKTDGQFRSIDYFFDSLAADQGHQSIGVILSGTATDGTLGLQAIKGADGITFAQDESAKYESMPRSAIAAGVVDFVLPPQKIAEELARIADHPYVALPTPAGEETEGSLIDVQDVEQEALKKIMMLLRNHRGIDFTSYRPKTIRRRIMRRMVLAKINALGGYAKHLRNNASELEALYQDLLIAVTSFFRTPEAFEILKRKVFPALMKDRSLDDSLRVWTIGCSTGQEAYSIAMSYLEYSSSISQNIRLQVFATDLNDELLEKARAGLYSKTLVQDVSPERLSRFFVEEEGGYRVSKTIREMCVFARQNVISDPPFSRIDLISCRNLLIYLEPELQRRLLPVFHYSLKPRGYLFLGVSESVGGYSSLFEPMDKKIKIFAKKPSATHQFPPASLVGHVPKKIIQEKTPPTRFRDVMTTELSAEKEADRVALARYGPPGVVINAASEILQFRGDTSPYLIPPRGRATLNVLKMAREGLMLPLRTVINKAKKENKRARKEDVRVSQDGEMRDIDLEVIPLKNVKEPCFLILFEPGGSVPSEAIKPSKAKSSAKRGLRQESREVARLERELAETRDYLQAIQEQYDAANEELQASSEEAQSGNEELQSINEELETSKEELESTNEELTTVNEEMLNRNAELTRLNSDIVNLQSSINVAILLLGRDLLIRRFTLPAEKLFNLLASDIGRPIGVIKHNLNFPGLETLVSDVIESLVAQEREVRDRDGRWFLLRVRPYMTLENKIDGAVLMLVDITIQKQAEEAKGRLAAIIESSDDAIISKDLNGIIATWNQSAEVLFGYTAQEAIGKSITMLSPPERMKEELSILEHIRQGKHISHYETVGERKDGTTVEISLAVSPVFDDAGDIIGGSRIAHDITERRRAEEKLDALLLREQAARAEAEAANRLKDEFLAIVSHEVRTPLNAIVGWIHMLRSGKLDDDQIEKALESIDRNAASQAEIITELLDTSRIISGKMKLDPKPLDIPSIIEAAVEVMRPAAEAKSIEIETMLDHDAGPTWGDSARLQQVLWNLLSNAIKFTPNGGNVEVRFERSATGVAIIVKDTGQGIEPDFIPFVFERFRQAQSATTRAYGGLGLGLSIVRNIVEMHGGSVRAESAGKDRGATFTIALPIRALSDFPREEESHVAHEVKSEAPSTLQESVRLDGVGVLVVDDDPDSRELLKIWLTTSGAEVTTCVSSADALAEIKRQKPDCIVSDVGMPGEDGYGFMTKLREFEKKDGGKIPAIALTGFAGADHKIRADAAGYQAHISKPVALGKLTSEIARLIALAAA